MSILLQKNTHITPRRKYRNRQINDEKRNGCQKQYDKATHTGTPAARSRSAYNSASSWRGSWSAVAMNAGQAVSSVAARRGKGRAGEGGETSSVARGSPHVPSEALFRGKPRQRYGSMKSGRASITAATQCHQPCPAVKDTEMEEGIWNLRR